MRLPLQVTFRHMDPSPALEARTRSLAERLDKFSPQIDVTQSTSAAEPTP